MTDEQLADMLGRLEKRICDKIETLRTAIYGNGRRGLSVELAELRTSVGSCQKRHAITTGRRWDMWKIVLACLVSAFGSQLLSQRAYTQQAADTAPPVSTIVSPTEPPP